MSQKPQRFFLILNTDVDNVLFSDFCFTSFFLSVDPPAAAPAAAPLPEAVAEAKLAGGH